MESERDFFVAQLDFYCCKSTTLSQLRINENQKCRPISQEKNGNNYNFELQNVKF